MTNHSKTRLKLAEVIPRIRSVYSLIGFIVIIVAEVVVYVVGFPRVHPSVLLVVLTFEVGIFVVLIILAQRIPSTSPKPLPETSDPTLTRTNLTVDLPIWENLVHSLKKMRFTNLEREKRVWIHDRDYYFSWAEYDSKKLALLQLERWELKVPNLRMIHSIMRIDLSNLANITVAGYVIVCDTSKLSDTCYEYLESLKEPLKCICFTNYSLDLIKRKDEIALSHLKAKLLPCIVC